MPRSNVLVVLITLSFLWGSSFLAIKAVIDVVPPILAFGIRFAIAGAALLVLHIINERLQNLNTELQLTNATVIDDAIRVCIQ